MATTPNRKSKQPKKKRPSLDHIPALTPEKLELALQRLQTLNISAAAKRQLELMVRAASNPNSERIDVVIASLDAERKGNVEETTKAITSVTRNVTGRARAAMLAMNNEEWERLVREANDEGE